jgi:hypothetical protein
LYVQPIPAIATCKCGPFSLQSLADANELSSTRPARSVPPRNRSGAIAATPHSGLPFPLRTGNRASKARPEDRLFKSVANPQRVNHAHRSFPLNCGSAHYAERSC